MLANFGKALVNFDQQRRMRAKFGRQISNFGQLWSNIGPLLPPQNAIEVEAQLTDIFHLLAKFGPQRPIFVEFC